MPRAALTEVDVESIVAEYDRGATRVELATRYGVHPNTITRALQRSGTGSRSARKRALDIADERQLIEAYRAGIPTIEIAAEYGISAAHVSRVALANGASARRPNLPGRPRLVDPETALTIGREYRGGASLQELASRNNVSATTILRTLERSRVGRRPRSATWKLGSS